MEDLHAVVFGDDAVELERPTDAGGAESVRVRRDVLADLHEVGDALTGGPGPRDAARVLGHVTQGLHGGAQVGGEQDEVTHTHRAVEDP